MSPPKSQPRTSPPSRRNQPKTSPPPRRNQYRHEELSSDGSSSEDDIDGDGSFHRLRRKMYSPKNNSNCESESVEDLTALIENNLSTSESEPIVGSPRRSSSSNLYPILDESLLLGGDKVCTPIKHSHKAPTEKENNTCFIVIAVIAIIALLLSGLYIYYFNNQKGQSPSIFVEDIGSMLSSIFVAQNKDIWRMIRSQLRHQLPGRRKPDAESNRRSPPSRPAILLLVGSMKSATLRCFSRKLGDLVAQSFGRSVCVRADADTDENSGSGHVAKWQMDQVVKNSYRQGERCFHVQGLGSLSAEELLMLHAWCDGDFSPYKDAVILISLAMSNTSSVNTISEATVETYLNDRWRKLLGPDETAALLSRVANNIVVVQEEKDSHNFRSHCFT